MPDAFCIGGPLDGTWIKVQGRIFQIPCTQPIGLLQEYITQEAVTVEIVTYRLELFTTSGDSTNPEIVHFYIQHGVSVMGALRKLIDGYALTREFPH